MKKIPSVFKRNYNGDRLVYPEVVEGCEWVLEGEGTPTVKWDGTACLVKSGLLYKRFDRKKNKKTGRVKAAPLAGWIPSEVSPDENTGHWPGWTPVGVGAEDKWYREPELPKQDGTYELIGPKIQGNPHGTEEHEFRRHGDMGLGGMPGHTFIEIRGLLSHFGIEGIVWHHPDGRMAKIKSKDFGFPWPTVKEVSP